MKDTLMKYETIDALQIDDLMERVTPRPPASWNTTDKNSSGDDTPTASGDSSNTEDKKDDTVTTLDTSKPSTDAPTS